MERIRISWRQTVFVMAALVLAFGLAGCEMITGALNGDGGGGGSKKEPTLVVSPNNGVEVGVPGSGVDPTITILVQAKDASGSVEGFNVTINKTSFVSITNKIPGKSFDLQAKAPGGPTSVTVLSDSGKQVTFQVDTKPAISIPIPSGLTKIGGDYQGVSLSWNPVSIAGVQGIVYNVERKTGAGVFGPVANGSNLTSPSFNDSGLTAATTYTYHVQASLPDGTKGAFGASLDVTTNDLPNATAVPMAPTGLTASNPTTSSIDLAWSQTDNSVTSWDVQQSTASAAGPWTLAVAGSTTKSTTVQGLLPETKYYFQVRGNNSKGSGPYSLTAFSTTLKPAAVSTIVAPGVSQGAVSSSSIQIKWNWVAGATSFQVQKKTPAGLWVDLAASVPLQDFTDLGLAASTSYTYQVRGLSGTVAGDWSLPITLSTTAASATALTVPSTSPVLSVLGSGTDFIQLSWGSVPYASGYSIYYAPNTAAVAYIGPITVQGGTTTMITGLTSGTSYKFQAEAWNSDGKVGPRSTTAFVASTSAATQNLPPPSTSLSLFVTASGAPQLSWTVSPGAQGYEIYRLDPGMADYFTVSSTDSTRLTFTDMSPLSAGSSYSYMVKAKNLYGSSASSNTVYFFKQGTVVGLAAPYQYPPSNFYSNYYVYLDWMTVPGASYYGVQAYDSSGTAVGSEYVTYGNSFQYTGMSYSTEYVFKIVAYDINNNPSAPSNSVSYTTPPDPNQVTTGPVTVEIR